MWNLLSIHLNESFFVADVVLHFQSAVIVVYENTDKICKILLFSASYGPRESGSSLRVSFFVPDRKQLQIARGIAAHGARQTEVSENKSLLQARNKAEEITNATSARLLPRETGTRIKIRELGDGKLHRPDDQNAF